MVGLPAPYRVVQWATRERVGGGGARGAGERGGHTHAERVAVCGRKLYRYSYFFDKKYMYSRTAYSISQVLVGWCNVK